MAVWLHAPSGTWRSFADRCPHRLVPLSEGRVEPSGRIQCGYHGWEFDGAGACVRIPQLGKGLSEDSPQVRSQRACSTSYPTRVAQGLVWVFPHPDPIAASMRPLPLIPELDDPSFLDATDFYVRDLPYSWDKLVENLVDPSHLPYAHHTLIKGADRDLALELDLAVVSSSPLGFEARQKPYPDRGGRYDLSFTAPTLVQYTLISPGAKAGTHIGLGQYCVPSDTPAPDCQLSFPARTFCVFAPALPGASSPL